MESLLPQVGEGKRRDEKSGEEKRLTLIYCPFRKKEIAFQKDKPAPLKNVLTDQIDAGANEYYFFHGLVKPLHRETQERERETDTERYTNTETIRQRGRDCYLVRQKDKEKEVTRTLYLCLSELEVPTEHYGLWFR